MVSSSSNTGCSMVLHSDSLLSSSHSRVFDEGTKKSQYKIQSQRPYTQKKKHCSAASPNSIDYYSAHNKNRNSHVFWSPRVNTPNIPKSNLAGLRDHWTWDSIGNLTFQVEEQSTNSPWSTEGPADSTRAVGVRAGVSMILRV